LLGFFRPSENLIDKSAQNDARTTHVDLWNALHSWEAGMKIALDEWRGSFDGRPSMFIKRLLDRWGWRVEIEHVDR
jgi:hypothetical protein